MRMRSARNCTGIRNRESIRFCRERWGERVIAKDGTTEKRTVAEIVFAEENERKWLEEIVHPFIEREAERRIAGFAPDARVMFDVPLLFECGWEKRVERTIAVWASPGVQMNRLLERGWSREHAQYRIASQLPADRKLELADYGIINDFDWNTLKAQCAELNRPSEFVSGANRRSGIQTA